MRFRTSRTLPRKTSRDQRRPLFEALECRALLTTIVWTNNSGGDWDTSSNWSTDSVPGRSDDAEIDIANITITHGGSAADTVNSLTISSSDTGLNISNGSLSIVSTSLISGNLTIGGGALSTSGTLTIDGLMNWTGGTIVGPGALSAQMGITSSHAGSA